MCGQCAFLKEKYYKEGNGGGKEYYCEYLKEYVCVLVGVALIIKKIIKKVMTRLIVS